MVAVGVNKAADQYVLLNERTEQEMADGRYKRQPEVPSAARVSSRASPARQTRRTPVPARPPVATASRPRWSQVQENLAIIYRAMGMNPEEIAKKLGVSQYLATQILLYARV
jgi:hypothetical protein